MIRCITSNTIIIRKLSSNLTNFQSVSYSATCSLIKYESSPRHDNRTNLNLLSPYNFQTTFTRSSTSFFCQSSAEQLWKSVTGVSNAGKKRGRGKGAGRKVIKDLNRGQVIGIGPKNIVWPGLSAPVIRGKELVQQIQLPPDPEREARLLKLRDQLGRFKPLKLSPMERGYSGAKMHGRKCGPPDDIGLDTFEGFETIILEMKTVASVDGNIGKVRRYSCMVFTGNGNGLGGLALAKSPEGKGAIRRARNRAGQKLLNIHRYKDHTVMHDFYTRFGQTTVFVTKKPEGFGLVCHRIIKSMCQLVGIKDLYAKVEGAMNAQHIAKAFLLGLLRQKSHQELANVKSLFLVEQREDCFNFPVVVGVPERCRTDAELDPDETMDFTLFAMEGHIPLLKIKSTAVTPRFYVGTPSWGRFLLRTERYRNLNDTRVRLLAHYGGDKHHPYSHLTAKYPECWKRYARLLFEKQKAERLAAEANDEL